MTEVTLWDEPLGVVVPGPSGVVYTNQTGGTACRHPKLEGYFVPLPSGWVPVNNPLIDVWGSPYNAGLVLDLLKAGVEDDEAPTLGRWFEPLSAADLATALARDEPGLDEFFDDDRSFDRLMEAWVPLRVRHDCDYPALVPYRGRLVVLTYENSD